MTDVLDMLQCQDCGTWYVPEFTVTGRVVPHCLDLKPHELPRTGKLLTDKLPRGSIIDVEV